jgi:5-formyltetrahydrofolate cyclo-ligase
LTALDIAKQQAREKALAAAGKCLPAWGEQLGKWVLEIIKPPSDAVIAGFWPLAGEIDIRPLLHALVAEGHSIVLPETPKRGEALRFRRWQPGGRMLPGRFGTMVPDGEYLTPTWLLVPLVAFDRQGHRLGYGGGYYDRTLKLLDGAARIGCAFAAQELDEVPTGPYDVSLDAVATERGVILCPARKEN